MGWAMGHKILVIVLTVLVFFTAVSSGVVYYESLVAEEKLRVASQIKSKVSSLIKKANVKVEGEKQKRIKTEKTLLRTAKDLANALDERKTLKNQVSSLQKNLSKKTQNIKTFATSMQKLGDELEQERKAKQELEKKLSKTKNDLHNVNLKYTVSEEAQADIKTQQKQLDKLKERVQDQNKINNELRSKLEKTENELKISRQDASNSKEDSKKVKEALTKISVLEKKLQAADNRLKSEMLAKSKLDKELASQKEKIKQLSIKLASLKTESIKKEEKKNKQDKKKLNENEVAKKVQQELKRVGCYAGKIDGLWGESSQTALNNFRKEANLKYYLSFLGENTITQLKSKGPGYCKSAAKQTEAGNKKGLSACLNACDVEFDNKAECRQECFAKN